MYAWRSKGGLVSSYDFRDDETAESPGLAGVSRRDFLGMSIASMPAVGVAVGTVKATRPARPETPAPAAAKGAGTMPVRLNVNGKDRQLQLDPRTSLLDALRESLDLAGTKKGCDHGQCGACTVLIDDRRVLSCLTLAAMASGHRVTTIEGLAQGDHLHPVQAAFLKHDAFQCGYCTPGQIVSAVGLLKEGCPGDDASIRECMSGNLCRCGAYPNIVAAVQEARGGKKA
jgi:xanthine dehydrogenase YagT iron-sulfur-binding subunit